MKTPRFMSDRTGLQTEFYQLVQAAVYHGDGLWGEACFDLYAKRLPPHSTFLVAAGIQPAIDDILQMRFQDAEIAWLQQHPAFSRLSGHFFESLRHWRFTGRVEAVPEGTIVYPGEPILRVTAPLPQAGLLETRLVQTISHATGVASRAAQLCEAARGRPVIDFGSRRCSGPQAAWAAARAAWIAGVEGTTNTQAAATLDIPAWGVMSDSLLAAYEDSQNAYSALHQYFPGLCYVNLPDEDVQEGVRQLSAVKDDVPIIRLDHDDLATNARALRRSLDRHGMHHTRLLGSSSLDPHKIQALVSDGVPIDMFGVGQALVAGPSAPLSYRIAQMYRGPDAAPVTRHFSAPWPGEKQIVRMADHDVICLDIEALTYQAQGGQPLLHPVVADGQRVDEPEPLLKMRERCMDQLALAAELPKDQTWSVRASPALTDLSTPRG